MTQELPLWMQANTYAARVDRQLFDFLFNEGVVSGLLVQQRGAGANMSVDVGVGAAIIKGDDQAAQGSYLAITTAVENIVIGAAPGSNSRRDLIYYRVNDPNATGPAGSNAAFGVVAGTAAASPTLPALPTSAIPLAEVLVASGTVSITNSLITSLRTPMVAKNGVLPGTIVAYGGDETMLGSGDWALCNGQAFTRLTDFGLFKAIGTSWGAGNGTTTFNGPDLRGVALAGRDDMGGAAAGKLTGATVVGTMLGAQTVTLAQANLPAHQHTVPDHSHTLTGGAAGQGGSKIFWTVPASGGGAGWPWTTSNGSGMEGHFGSSLGTSLVSGVVTGSIGSATPVANIQPTAIVNYIIKK